MSGGGLLSLPRLLDEALRRARPLVRTQFVPAAAVMATCQVAAVLAQFGNAGHLATGELATGFALLAVALVCRAGATYAYVPLGIAAAGAVAGRPVTAAQAWRLAVRGRTLGTVLLSGLCVAVAYVCCLVPALFVAPLLSLVLPAIALEGRFGTAAIARSAELTGFNPRRRIVGDGVSRGFVVLLAGYLVSTLLTLPIQLPVQAVVMLRTFGRAVSEGGAAASPLADSLVLWLQVPAAILVAMATACAALYVGCAAGLLFLDLRRRREAPDLEAAMDELEAQG